jgi:hypothetical protein
MLRNPIASGDRDVDARGLDPKRYVAELRGRDLSEDAAAKKVARTFGVSYAAARMFVASHPSWSVDPLD